jgi:hypothetical protein
MHTCMMPVRRLLASENLRLLSSHPYRFSPERVHVHEVPLDENGFVHIPQAPLGYAYGRVLQGRISHHKYHLYNLSSSCIQRGWGACTNRPKALLQVIITDLWLQVTNIHGSSLAAVWTGLIDTAPLPFCAVLLLTRCLVWIIWL